METSLTWVAPVATIIAALMTASNLGAKITGTGFIVFTVGSVSWLTLGMIRDDSALLWMNVVLTVLNLIGIWRWLGRQAKFEDGGSMPPSEQGADRDPVPLSLAIKASVTGRGGADLGRASTPWPLRKRAHRYLVVAEGGVAGVGETLRRIDWRGCDGRRDTKSLR